MLRLGRATTRLASASAWLDRRAILGVLAFAASLRLVALPAIPIDPFYAGAVRSMGMSWHNFLVGAYDPSATLAIDKAPVGLWLQVGSTKLLGFTPTAMLLPGALCGVAAVGALYDFLRTVAGRRVALAGATALAVLPISVITSRSDTMDSVMAALMIGAFAVAARGMRDHRTSRMVIAGAMLGLAFEVKLFESLIAIVPLGLLWWLGAEGSRGRRARALGLAVVALVAVGLAWLIALRAFVPAAERPWAFGSSNGSAWNATFVYDGWQRLTDGGPPTSSPAARHVPGPPSPLRLFSSQVHLGARIGYGLALAWLGVVLLVAKRARLDRRARAAASAMAMWLALGTVLCSAQADLRPRYLEVFTPAVAGWTGVLVVLACAWLTARRLRVVAAATTLATLSVPAAISASAVAHHVQTSGTPGLLPPGRLDALSAYLRARQGTARYETAYGPVAQAGGLIARDGRPVLMLEALGRPRVSVATVRALVARGELRSAVVGRTRTPAARWIRAHGTDVSALAGSPHPRTVYALDRGDA